MKLICFQAKRFRWKTHSKKLLHVADVDVEAQITDAVVVFLHAEATDRDEARSKSISRNLEAHQMAR